MLQSNQCRLFIADADPTVAAKVAEVSWGGFAAPTPEAENWQPDPDSIPVAGGLPDLRLNKDPLTKQ